ncbi:hypothetical protein FNV43_RR05271 [Rhamnella rubrinervis]|uniref:Uncharacterized protein n=1 Tax=Rhamnella rubrinervis TaxID=2594499 RepID=A0A8K0MR27_9ROSA|nr:hypothetical protein FNV43_RR05271 [Rhamnella rubrinervis]
MITRGSDLAYKPLGITQRNKHFSKQCLTKELSMSNFSLEDYHGGSSVSVPFIWESEPGTPKVKFRENPLPPLTPPPSYCYTSRKTPFRKPSKSNLLQAIFPKHVSTKTPTLPPSPLFIVVFFFILIFTEVVIIFGPIFSDNIVEIPWTG